METTSRVLFKTQCPQCKEAGADTTGDNLSVYDDNHCHCYACGFHRKNWWSVERSETSLEHSFSSKDKNTKNIINSKLYLKDRVQPRMETVNNPINFISWRGISKDTMAHYGVSYDGINLHFPYGPNAEKLRSTKAKDFFWQGAAKDSQGLFGKDKFVAGGNYAVTITEGELDAMSAYQMLGSKYACVSIKGASSAKADCSKEYDWLNSFEKIYLCLDNDEPGQKAASEIAKLFDVNKVYWVKLPKFKDANEALQAGEDKLFSSAWWNAKKHRPANIIADWAEAAKILDRDDAKPIATWAFPDIEQKLWGIRTGEMVLISAPQKIGKTEFLRACQYHLLKTTDHNIGVIHLEEKEKRYIQGLATYELGQPCHLPNTTTSKQEQIEAFKKATGRDGRLHLYKHFGTNDPDVILDSVRYMAGAADCKIVFLDNLTILTNSEPDADERKVIDHLTKELVRMVLDLDFCLVLVSHVNDDGQIFGSRMPGKICNAHLQLSRDKEAVDPEVRNLMNVMIKDNRFGGETGPARPLRFDPRTYTLRETEPPIELDITQAA